MIVYVNKNEVSLFSGATARDAVRKYEQDYRKDGESGKARSVSDKNGNTIDPGGALIDGQQLFVEY